MTRTTNSAPHAIPPVTIVSHGYENIYERGFCNGLSDNEVPFVLLSSDQTDYAGLRKGTRTVNLRGSQDSRRPKLAKILNLVRYHVQLVAYAWSHRRSPVHVIGLIHPPFLCGVIEGLWFRLVCRHYLVTVHNLLPHDRETLWNKIIFRITYRLAGTLVVHTPKVRDTLISQHGISPDRVIVMEHGLEPLSRQPTFPPPRPRDAPFHLLFFGKVMHYKGVDILLEALKLFPHPFRLVIAGASSDAALTRDLDERISSHPHRDSISWINRYIAEKEIEPLFLEADALLLPYRRIDQSGVLFQALRFGLPTIATNVGALAEYVTEDVGEMAEPENPKSLAGALERLRERRSELSRSEVASAARQYEWQNTTRVLGTRYSK